MVEQTLEERRTAENEARRLHSSVDLIGLRAQATAVGLLQLTAELLRAGVIDDAAIGRIKNAIATDIIVSRKASRGRDEFEHSLRKRLDETFPKSGNSKPSELGAAEDMPSALGTPEE